MILRTYKRHLPALLVVLVTIGSWSALLRSLPNPMAVHCAFSGPPVPAGEPMAAFVALCGFMVLAHVVIVTLDFFLFVPVVPGHIMAAVDWIAEGTAGIVYLSILGDAAGVIPTCTVGLITGAVMMLVVLGALYRRARESVENTVGPLFDAPYFERVGPSLLMRILFFLRPMFPSYIIVIPGGIRIIGVLYDVTYPWDRIEQVKKGDLATFFSNLPIKLNHTLTNTVEIHLKDRRRYVVVSIGHRDRFLETVAKLMPEG